MNKTVLLLALLMSALAPGPSWAGTAGGLYDMQGSIAAAHPFAGVARVARPRFKPAAATLFKYFTSASAAARTTRAASTTIPGKIARTGSIIAEVRAGILADVDGLFATSKEGGVGGSVEITFAAPDFLAPIFSPRPHLGLVAGKRARLYAGLTWSVPLPDWQRLDRVFLEFGFGAALQPGDDFGCDLAFRGALDLGYRFGGRHAVSLHLAGLTDAGLCAGGDGLETVGLRYGYRF